MAGAPTPTVTGCCASMGAFNGRGPTVSPDAVRFLSDI